MKTTQPSISRSDQRKFRWWHMLTIFLLFGGISLSIWLFTAKPILDAYFTNRETQSENLLPSSKFKVQTISTDLIQTGASVNHPPQSISQQEPPPFRPLIHVVPIDGQAMFVSAYNPEVSGSVRLNYDLTSANGHYLDGFAMTYSETVRSYVGVIEHNFANGNTSGLISFSNTDDSGDTSSTTTELKQNYVPLESSDPDVTSEDGQVHLSIVNQDTFSADAYITIVTSVQPTQTLDDASTFVGLPYTIRASGALSETEQIMLLNIAYNTQLVGGIDPQSLGIVAWDLSEQKWYEIESRVLTSDRSVSAAITKFTSYSLILKTTATWHDDFENFHKLDLKTLNNLDSRSSEDGQELFVDNSNQSGSIFSKPIVPPMGDFDLWGTVTFDAELSSMEPLSEDFFTIDIMSDTETILMRNVMSGTDISTVIDPRQHKSLQLRVTMTETEQATPMLSSWGISWVREAAPGDVNCDNRVDPADALFILQYTIKNREQSEGCWPGEGELHLPSCDVSGDGECTGLDALLLMQCDINISNSLCPTIEEDKR